MHSFSPQPIPRTGASTLHAMPHVSWCQAILVGIFFSLQRCSGGGSYFGGGATANRAQQKATDDKHPDEVVREDMVGYWGATNCFHSACVVKHTVMLSSSLFISSLFMSIHAYLRSWAIHWNDVSSLPVLLFMAINAYLGNWATQLAP